MYVYFDIGGTKTRVSISHDQQTFVEPRKFDTPQDFETLLAMLRETVRELGGDESIEAVGGGIAGPFDRARSVLLTAPNLPSAWAGRHVADELVGVFGAPVFIENDSAIVALGEAYHGAGKGDGIVAYITVSTGVGGARIVDGHIDRSVFGFEPGHQILDIDKTIFPMLHAPDAEGLLSGTATAKRFGMKAYEVADPAVWEELSLLLAHMLNNTIVHWSPDSVVLGGSMIVGDPAISVDRVAYHPR